MLMPVPVGTDAGDPAPAVHEPGLPVPKPEDPPTETTSASSSGPRGTATPVVNPVAQPLMAQEAMATETLRVKRGREELADDSGDEERIPGCSGEDHRGRQVDVGSERSAA